MSENPLQAGDVAVDHASSRLDFLLALDDAVRPLTDASQITSVAATHLGVHLQVNRCAYAEVEGDQDTFDLTGNYVQGVPSIVGRYRFAAFGAECLRLMRAGLPYVVTDAHSDPRTQDVQPAYRQTAIRAVICVPLMKGGRFAAAIAVHQREPRQWTAQDVELVQLVASRCWESVERARVTRELSEAHERLRAAIDAGDVATWVWHTQERVITGDRNVARLFGREQDSVSVTTVEYTAIVHPDDVGQWLAKLQSCLTGDSETFEADYRIVLPDGDIQYVNAKGRMQRPTQRGAYMPGVMVDVTARRRVEDELRAAEQKLQQLNESLEARIRNRTEAWMRSERQFSQLVAGITDCAIYMLDVSGRVSSWNPGAERIKGYSAEEIVGRHFSTFYSDADRKAGLPAQTLASVADHGKFEGEGWRIRKDGSKFWASVLIDPIFGPDRLLVGYAKITRDMTERRAMQEQLNQSQKMEAIGQLTGGVAHDFNNLLTVILGNLDTLSRRQAADDPRSVRAVDHATRAAQRAAALTQQLLAFSRRQPLNPKLTNLNDLLRSLVDLLRRTLPEAISLRTEMASDLWTVEVDPNHLENALLNLAVNARDAMGTSGTLTIQTSNLQIAAGPGGSIIDLAAGDYVLVCVRDTGAGMSSDVIARAFEPFFTTKAIGQGTGLGLSQVFGFVKQSGGHVGLVSQVGMGTSVNIYLPRVTGEIVEVATPVPVEDPRAHAGETILVVEDEDDLRIYSTESLSELGFTVLQAVDAPSALKVLQNHPEILLLFTDVGLPGLNGRELVEAARKIRPQLRVLFTTGYARDAIVHDGRLDAGVHLLTKPFTRAQLAAGVRTMLDSTH